MQGNGWGLDVLVHCRRDAGPWLSGKAAAFGGDAGKHLAAAAEHYGRLVEACTKGLGSTWELALPPSKAEHWSKELRREQIRRLEVARERDGDAIAAIEKALASV
jgi:hypothetical protein